MKIEVVYSLWAADGAKEPFQGGIHGPDERSELANPSAKLLRSIAGAEAAGVVHVLEATKDERSKLDKAVQSQEDGEKAQAKAQADVDPETGQIIGPWQHGNHVDFIARRNAQLQADAERDPDRRLTKDERNRIEAEVNEAAQRLKLLKEPT